MKCSVIYLDGKSSKTHQAILQVWSDEVRVDDSSGHCLEKAMFSNLTLSPPLSNRDRFLKFAGGARCQFSDDEVIRFLDRELHSSPGLDIVHYLESSWRMVFVSSVALVLFTWVFMSFGIPAIAKHVAMAVPASIMDPLSAKTVEMLDERFFGDSKLSEERKQEVRDVFRPVCLDFGQEARCELLFRQGGEQIGANAFALPSGQIIMTDECIEMAQSLDEIQGVLVHEMGHVQERHSIRHALQHTGVFFLISALVGDIGSISSLATTLPMVLVESGYSREFEEEADQIACLYLLANGKTTTPYQAILTRMTEDKPSGSSLFSSHPETRKRVKLMMEIEKGYVR